MPQYAIRSMRDREELFEKMRRAKLPYTVEVTKGVRRSVSQNRLQRLWLREGGEQIDGWESEDLRAYCKLTIGVPILRRDSESFQGQYDRVVRPLSYEQKIDLMQLPIDFPVTRLMTTAQKREYLDQMYHTIAGMGARLTEPDKGDLG